MAVPRVPDVPPLDPPDEHAAIKATQTATGSGALYVGVVVCVTCTGRPSVRLPIMSTSEGKGARARLAVRESAELR